MLEILQGVMTPFIGTALGAALVFFSNRQPRPGLRRALTGFAAGVMVAASVWSLLLPALEQASGLGAWAFVPAAGGFWLGVALLMLLDGAIPRLCGRAGSGDAMMILAVTLHNVPEGMAVGVAYAGYRLGNPGVTAMGAFSLALGIAIQNLPEGAIIALPLHARGVSRGRAFLGGALSGAVEPLGAALMLAMAGRLAPLMPWFLSFAAGAMLYVVVAELIPEMSVAPRARTGTLLFVAGFTVMMGLDVALG